MIKKPDFFARCSRFIETKSWLKNNECGQSGLRFNGKTDFSCANTNSGKLKVTLIIFR